MEYTLVRVRVNLPLGALTLTLTLTLGSTCRLEPASPRKRVAHVAVIVRNAPRSGHSTWPGVGIVVVVVVDRVGAGLIQVKARVRVRVRVGGEG